MSVDNSKLPFGDLTAWTKQVNAAPLISAVAIVLILGAFQATRRFAVPIGVVIMAVWYFKFKTKGG